MPSPERSTEGGGRQYREVVNDALSGVYFPDVESAVEIFWLFLGRRRVNREVKFCLYGILKV